MLAATLRLFFFMKLLSFDEIFLLSHRFCYFQKIYNLQCICCEKVPSQRPIYRQKKIYEKPPRIILWPRFFLLPYKTKKTPTTTKKGCCFLWALSTLPPTIIHELEGVFMKWWFIFQKWLILTFKVDNSWKYNKLGTKLLFLCRTYLERKIVAFTCVWSKIRNSMSWVICHLILQDFFSIYLKLNTFIC